MSGRPDRKTTLQLKTFEAKSAQRASIQAVEKSFDADWAAHFHQLTLGYTTMAVRHMGL
jgi:hypothetical protein